MKLESISWEALVVAGIGFVITALLSDWLVRLCSKYARPPESGTSESDKATRRAGFIIGRCENILVLTFILAGQFTALALVFAAKTLLKANDAGLSSRYVQLGTTVNFTFSVVAGIALRLVLTSAVSAA